MIGRSEVVRQCNEVCRQPEAREQLLTSRTRLVVDWAGMDAADLAALRDRHAPALGRWSIDNCLSQPASRWGKGLRYLGAAISVAATGHPAGRVVLWQQWIGYLWSLLPRRRGGPRVIICTVLYGPSNAPPGSLRRGLLVRALKRADALVYFSEGLAEETRRAWPQWAHKVHHTRMPLLDTGPDEPRAPGRTLDAQRPAPPSTARPVDSAHQTIAMPTPQHRPDRLRVFAGGSSERDVDLVVDAFSATEVPVTLVCPGHQTFTHPERLTANITVLRDVPEATFHALALASDVAVIALRSARSGCGQLLFTFCMGHGIALIATEAHGTRDYVAHERTGLLIPVGDAHALRAAYQRLSADPSLRQRLRDGGRALARQLSFGHFARFVDAV